MLKFKQTELSLIMVSLIDRVLILCAGLEFKVLPLFSSFEVQQQTIGVLSFDCEMAELFRFLLEVGAVEFAGEEVYVDGLTQGLVSTAVYPSFRFCGFGVPSNGFFGLLAGRDQGCEGSGLIFQGEGVSSLRIGLGGAVVYGVTGGALLS